MPSIRPGLYSPECPLREYELPTVPAELIDATGQSARAVAFHAELVGQPAEDPFLNACAKACAQKIMAGECSVWLFGGSKAGFHLRD